MWICIGAFSFRSHGSSGPYRKTLHCRKTTPSMMLNNHVLFSSHLFVSALTIRPTFKAWQVYLRTTTPELLNIDEGQMQ